MKTMFEALNDNDHYKRAIALATEDAIAYARLEFADRPDLLAKVLARPHVDIIGMLLSDCIAYAIESANDMAQAHDNIHVIQEIIETVHAQIAIWDSEPPKPTEAIPVANNGKTFVN